MWRVDKSFISDLVISSDYPFCRIRLSQNDNDFIFWETREKGDNDDEENVNNEKLPSQSHHRHYLLFFMNHTYFPCMPLCMWKSFYKRTHAYTSKLQWQRTTCTSVFQRKEGWQNEREIRYSQMLLHRILQTTAVNLMYLVVKLTLINSTKLYRNNTLMSSI